MYPDIQRPIIFPNELLELYPQFKTNIVFYKCLYLYRKHKESQGQDARVLLEGAFK